MSVQGSTRRRAPDGGRGMSLGSSILTMLLAGCQPPDAALSGDVENPGEVLAQAADGEAPLSRSVDEFTVTPQTISSCPGASPIIVVVDWKARDLAIRTLRIEVVDRGATERKLLSESGRQGSVSTESWVTAGHSFFLVDDATGKDLASVVMKAKPCV